jgi:hypothetical protein
MAGIHTMGTTPTNASFERLTLTGNQAGKTNVILRNGAYSFNYASVIDMSEFVMDTPSAGGYCLAINNAIASVTNVDFSSTNPDDKTNGKTALVFSNCRANVYSCAFAGVNYAIRASSSDVGVNDITIANTCTIGLRVDMGSIRRSSTVTNNAATPTQASNGGSIF